jgi:hypothetical protein
MSDACGSIFVSGYFEADTDRLVDILNHLHWDTDNEAKFDSHSEYVVSNLAGLRNPTIRPCDIDEPFDDYSLEELSKMISPTLREGTIEFTAYGVNHCDRFEERLLIRCDGFAELHCRENGTLTYSDFFDPTAVAA